MSGFGGTLLKYYTDGGWAMHPILLLSIFGVMVILYKFIVFFRSKINTQELVSKVRKTLLDEQPNDEKIESAIKICEEYRGPVASVMKAGLLRFDSPRQEVEKTIENSAIHEVAALESWLPALATISNIAPLLGFFGTVVGMIQSFDVIAAQGLNNPGAVAKGISVALLTTAFGLFVAFLTLPFYNYFTTSVATFLREMDTSANILLETRDEMGMGASGTGA